MNNKLVMKVEISSGNGMDLKNTCIWCACYVSWCANECGYIDKDIIPKFSICTDGINWFKGKKEWHDRGESYYLEISSFLIGMIKMEIKMVYQIMLEL